jgi:hypothetical protein
MMCPGVRYFWWTAAIGAIDLGEQLPAPRLGACANLNRAFLGFDVSGLAGK